MVAELGDVLHQHSVYRLSSELRISVLFTNPSPLTPRLRDKVLLISRTGPWITLTKPSPCVTLIFGWVNLTNFLHDSGHVCTSSRTLLMYEYNMKAIKSKSKNLSLGLSTTPRKCIRECKYSSIMVTWPIRRNE